MNCFNTWFSFLRKDEVDLFQPKQHRLGDQNRGKIVYIIEEDNKNLGFFAMYRRWVEYLYLAHICGFFPVIKAGKNFVYREFDGIKNTDNAFEYYFQQPVGIGTKDAYKSNRVIFSSINQRKMVELVLLGRDNCYYYNKQYLYMMSDVVRRYLTFNERTWSYISNGINELGIKQKKILGVHVRGTDFRKKFNDHPVFVSEQDVFEKIDNLIPSCGYERIFLATDDEVVLKNFKERYQDKLYSYVDVLRSSTNQSVVFQKNNRKNNQYLLGLEVIRDMYTLSLCDGLICGISQVAICAQMNKLARKEKYHDIEVINKGIYRNNRNFSR